MKKTIIFLLFVLVAGYGMSQGCSQCKMMAEQSAELKANDFGRNINVGILFLMAVPYCIITFLFRKQILRFFRKFIPAKS